MKKLYYQVKRIIVVALRGLRSKPEHYRPRQSQISNRSFEEVPITYNMNPVCQSIKIERKKKAEKQELVE